MKKVMSIFLLVLTLVSRTYAISYDYNEKLHENYINNPNDYKTNLYLAYDYLLRGKYENARFHYLKSLKANKRDYTALLGLADTYTYLGKKEKAIKIYKYLIYKTPNKVSAYIHLAKYYHYLKKYKHSLLVLERGRKKFPENNEIMKLIEESYMKIGKVRTKKESLISLLF